MKARTDSKLRTAAAPAISAATVKQAFDLVSRAARIATAAPLPLDSVSQLYDLRELLRKGATEERRLTQEVIAAMAGRDRLEGITAVAILGQRETLTPDVALFVEALGPKAYPALAVKITQARELMLPDLLRAISDVTTTPVLRVTERTDGAR